MMGTKQNVLALLESKRGQNISGSFIAQQLHISRNAVWKAIKELEKEGYKIQGITNKGYCLCGDNDILSVQGMLPFLLQTPMAEKILIYDACASTNKTAKEMAIAGAEHGTTIITDCQTAGQGRYGRAFYSPAGHGIYMSMVLHPGQLGLHTPTLVTALAAVAVCEAIEAITEKNPQIKWVNDIYLESKKICGILTEAVTDFESGNIQWIVVGIGINFSTPAMAFPEDLRQIAASIFPEGPPSTTRNHLAAEIVNRLTTPAHPHKEKEMLEKYKQRLLWLGQEILVTGNGEPYRAMALDIDAMGRLMVKKANGEVLFLSSGEISIQTIVNH